MQSNIYSEIAGYGFEDYEKIDDFIKAFIVPKLFAPVHFSEEHHSAVKKCIDFYSSARLDSLVKEVHKSHARNKQ